MVSKKERHEVVTIDARHMGFCCIAAFQGEVISIDSTELAQLTSDYCILDRTVAWKDMDQILLVRANGVTFITTKSTQLQRAIG